MIPNSPVMDLVDLVWIRLFRPVRAIAEPWDEGDGIEWAKMAVDRVTWQWLFGMPTPALCRGRLPSHWRPPLPGGGSRTATYPVADSHQARVNEGRTEERGPVIQRINRDLTAARPFITSRNRSTRMRRRRPAPHGRGGSARYRQPRAQAAQRSIATAASRTTVAMRIMTYQKQKKNNNIN